MADGAAFPFNRDITNLNPSNIGLIMKKDIENMSLPEFYAFQDRLVKVRRYRRRDMAVWQANKKITPSHEGIIFRKGVGQPQAYATDDQTTYKQTRVHTNMSRDGEFEKGSLVIVHAFEVPFPVTSKATAQTAGIVTNPKAVFTSDFDPALFCVSWLQQCELSFWRGETEIFRSLLEDFPAMTGLNGVLGSNQGALIQNGSHGMNILPGVQVLEGGDDFHVRIHPLASEFDMTTATGLGFEIVQQVKLHTIELVREYQ